MKSSIWLRGAPRPARPAGSGGLRGDAGLPVSGDGFTRSHWDFYRGFALTISVLLAVLSWLCFFGGPVAFSLLAVFCATVVVVLLAREAAAARA